MSGNLENCLMKVNNFINIDKDRKAFMDSFEQLRNQLFKRLRTNLVFKKLFNGERMQGSYGDNVKVKLPDEYDFVFHLRFPESALITVSADKQNPGFIKINLTNVLEKIKNQEHHSETYKCLKKWVTKENYLIVESLQAWLHSCFIKALNDLSYTITVNGLSSSLKYQHIGPAHTITVLNPNKYSVDFVPGILLNCNQAVLQKINCNWEAIPKPLNKSQLKMETILFRASYYIAEYEIIKDKYTLKCALRMMKKFRDAHPNMNNLKSYFIKTLFLWKAAEENGSFWRQSLSAVLIDMFGDLEECLDKGQLEFYWDNKSNLLGLLRQPEIVEMLKYVRKTNSKLRRAREQFMPSVQYDMFCLFLTAEERAQGNISNGARTTVPQHISNPTEENIPSLEKGRCCIL